MQGTKKRRMTVADLLRQRIIPILQAITVFIICFSVLYGGENIGLSDNGDFGRVMRCNNIKYADDTDSKYLFKQDYIMELENDKNIFTAMYSAWQLNEEAADIYSSPHFLIIKLSKELNVIGNAITGRPLNEYNIAYMAFLYILMLSIAAWVIFTFFADTKWYIWLSAFILFIFVFCDAGYLLYFNSFYGEPLQYTALMMLVAFGMLIYKRPSVPKVIGFFVSLYFFAGAKLANIPYSLLAGVLGLFIGIMRKDKLFKISVVAVGLVCIGNIANLYFSIPDWMNRDTTYQAVFFGIAKENDKAAEALKELGVDEKYAVLADTNAYMEPDEYPISITDEAFDEGFYSKVTKADIAVYYLKHPVKLVKELSRAIDNSAYIRPVAVGNSKTVQMEYTDKFSSWSQLRTRLKFLYEPWVIFAAFILITIYMMFINVFYVYNHKIESAQKRYMICALDILIIGLWVNLALPIVCNGEADLAKHMFLFTNCIDILFVVSILGIIMSPPKRMLVCVGGLGLLTAISYLRISLPVVEFGTYNGKPIEWEVEERLPDGTFMLSAKEAVAYMPFDDNTNNWEESDLRKWLHTEFVMEFTDMERAQLIPQTNKVILSYEDKERAESGTHSHYWNCTRDMVDNLSETAYSYTVTDLVAIPAIHTLKKISVSEPYWVLCPYTSNNYMQRYVNSDGFVLHTDVKTEQGIRPVIHYRPQPR